MSNCIQMNAMYILVIKLKTANDSRQWKLIFNPIYSWKAFMILQECVFSLPSWREWQKPDLLFSFCFTKTLLIATI